MICCLVLVSCLSVWLGFFISCTWQVNCHNDVIHFLLDMGADIDKLNCEGMSALAVCHVLYYPFHSLHPTFTEPPAKTQARFYPMPFFCISSYLLYVLVQINGFCTGS